MNSAPRATSVIVQGPAGDLEVLIDEPELERKPESIAVICHPHPLFGGTMTNKVTHILARAFNELDAVAIRFNFRGVGKSAGTHDDGRGETDDTQAILRWSAARWPGASIHLSGFSFGAAMALRASFEHPVATLVTVAPALRWLTQLKDGPNCPWLTVQGDRDDLVDVDAVRSWAANLARPPKLEIVSGGEHFFHGRLNDLRDIVKEWIVSNSAKL